MKKTTKSKITKKMTFSQVIEKHPELIEDLFEIGMHCVGCPMSNQETLEQGALAHGMDPDELVKRLNKKVG